MSKRKTDLDRAIEAVDKKIADHEADIRALRLAREHLENQRREKRGHTEGGRSI